MARTVITVNGRASVRVYCSMCGMITPHDVNGSHRFCGVCGRQVEIPQMKRMDTVR